MIIDMSLLKEQEEKEFDLGEALRSDKFNIIFCGTRDFDEVLNEFYFIYKENEPEVELLLRNEGDVIVSDKHSVTAKVKFPDIKKISRDSQGIPVLFKDGEWFVALGTSKDKQNMAKKYEKQINDIKPVKKFLKTVAKEIGSDIMEYLNADPVKDKDKIDDIVEKIKRKYEVKDGEDN